MRENQILTRAVRRFFFFPLDPTIPLVGQKKQVEYILLVSLSLMIWPILGKSQITKTLDPEKLWIQKMGSVWQFLEKFLWIQQNGPIPLEFPHKKGCRTDDSYSGENI